MKFKKVIGMLLAGVMLMSTVPVFAANTGTDDFTVYTSTGGYEEEVKEENLITIQEEIISINSELQTLKIEYDEAIQNNNTLKQTQLIFTANKLLDKLVIEFKKLENSDGDYNNNFIRSKRSTMSNSDGEYYDYFTKSFWITRNGIKSLSIYPINLPWSAPGINKAWAAIKRFHSWNSEWYNENSLYKQFMCHVNIAGSWKTPWNLEPSNTSPNPFTCN